MYYSLSPQKHGPLTLLVLLVLSSSFTIAYASPPTALPSGEEQGTHEFAPDIALPLGEPFSPQADGLHPKVMPGNYSEKNYRNISDGGDDTLIASFVNNMSSDLAVTSNGVLYSAFSCGENYSSTGIKVYRSEDGGNNWSEWASFSDPNPDIDYVSPCIHIAEGTVDRVFVSWRYKDLDSDEFRIEVAWSPLGEVAGFTVIPIEEISYFSGRISITSDASSNSDYNLYLVYATLIDGGSQGIRFARSTDYGTTWEDSYTIGALPGFDRKYTNPKISCGFGGFVHVAWTFQYNLEGQSDAARYRRVGNSADGGLASWDPIKSLTSTSSNFDEKPTAICASTTTAQVLVGVSLQEVENNNLSSGLIYSTNQGITFYGVQVMDFDMTDPSDISQNPQNNTWTMSGVSNDKAGFTWAPSTDLTEWNEFTYLSDEEQVYGIDMVLDPSHDYQVALDWWQFYPDEDETSRLFDAQWHAGEGYPNYEEGFPVDLFWDPVSDPAVVDVDDDGDLEIVFSDAVGAIRVYQSDGTPLPGWPVSTGHYLSSNPVAIGDMNGNGQKILLVGTEDGFVYGFNADGSVAQGWPLDTGENAPASVIIGSFGIVHRSAVVACGSTLRFLNFEGDLVPGTNVWDMVFFSYGQGMAIGDVDGDEINELVYSLNDRIYTREQASTAPEMERILGQDISDTPTLADFDFDGDVEIVVPTAQGFLFLLDDDGSNYPGWPYDSGIDAPMTSAAIANIVGSSEPEIVACSKNWSVHLLWAAGHLGIGYPVPMGGWYQYGAPVLGRVDGSSSDVVVGGRGNQAWAWQNLGQEIEGWPKTIQDHCYLDPAMGDLDLDNRNEIVFLTTDQLIVVDVNNTPHSKYYTWPMSGHNPQRTGCSNCLEDWVSSVEEKGPDQVSRISFSAPSPNPISSGASFSYSIPMRAVVELSIYDLRGRRVALVKREENAPGNYVLTWNGKNERGQSLASGNYVAAIQVRGSGVNQTLSRKITVLK